MKQANFSFFLSVLLGTVLLAAQIETPALAQYESTKQVSVSAKYARGENGWLDTEFDVANGALLEINASGRWRLGEGNLETDANGLTNYQNYESYRYGSLLGRIGKDGAIFLIGGRFKDRVYVSGRLYLSNNDTVSRDNSGSLVVRVRCEGCAQRNTVERTNKSFSVSSQYINESNNWFQTGIYVQSGAGLGITASGSWQLGRNEYNTDANGLENFRLNRGQRFGALLGRIGENGQEFLIGSRFVQKANSSGYLYLANNDTQADDNSGQLSVVIQCNGCSETPPRLSTPPVTPPPLPVPVPAIGGNPVIPPPLPVPVPVISGNPENASNGRAKQSFTVSSRYVSGQREWLDTGIDLRKNTRLTIRAEGRWKLNPYRDAVNANGNEDYQYRNLPFGALVGRIGDRGETFLIGRQYDERAGRGGRLYLASNDDIAEDNEGVLDVAVSCRRCASQSALGAGGKYEGDNDENDQSQDQYGNQGINADFLISRKWRMVDSSGYLVAKRVVLRRDGQVRTRGAKQDTGIATWRMENGSLLLLNGGGIVINRFAYDGSPGGEAVLRGHGYNDRQANYVLIETR